MGEAKIRKSKGEHPVVDHSDEGKIRRLLFQQALKDAAAKGYADGKSRILAQKRCKPLPEDNENYHFPKMIEGKDCTVFCRDFCDGDYNENKNETVGLGEMAAHIIMNGGRVSCITISKISAIM